ncbi:MAG: carcinine hydrolase/isopenicillin-N N-acyltransferase family protein [Candidatus Neomarinimicrobiota bacterium]
MKKTITIFLLLFSGLFACTSAIISGKATPDGRPLLWKHRDTGSLENKLVFITESGFDFLGVANATDLKSEEIWMGMNEKGFAIMNTASYNINEGLSLDIERDQEGIFMRQALESCANLHDFELMLDRTSGKRGIDANFGVIDARGNAAFYETGFYEHTKFDVNDPEIAPEGYLIRTNFSFTGKGDKGVGYIRYDATSALFAKQNEFTPEFIMKEATRNMDHGLLINDIGNTKLPKDLGDVKMLDFQDYIIRYYSASVLVVQGTQPGEDPGNAVLWTILGFPMTTMVTPVFFSKEIDLPQVLTTQSTDAPFLSAASIALKDEFFPVKFDDKKNYIDVSKIKNRKKTGYMQRVMKAEDLIIEKARHVMESRSKDSIENYYKWLDQYIYDFYAPIIPTEKLKYDLPRCAVE